MINKNLNYITIKEPARQKIKNDIEDFLLKNKVKQTELEMRATKKLSPTWKEKSQQDFAIHKDKTEAKENASEE